MRVTPRTAVPSALLATTVLLAGCASTPPSADVRTTPAARASTTPSAVPAPTTIPAPTPTAEVEESASVVLDRLSVKGRSSMTGYERVHFGQPWLDADRNGCDTRNDMLNAHLTHLIHKHGTRDCVVLSGDLADPYTSRSIHFVRGDGFLVDIDHVVPLGNVWVTGGATWDIKKRAAIANDPLNLEPVDASTNRQKGDGDAATWLPPNKDFRCAYVARQVAVKDKYGLWVTPPEKKAIARLLARCPDEHVPADSGAPTSVTLNIHEP